MPCFMSLSQYWGEGAKFWHGSCLPVHATGALCADLVPEEAYHAPLPQFPRHIMPILTCCTIEARSLVGWLEVSTSTRSSARHRAGQALHEAQALCRRTTISMGFICPLNSYPRQAGSSQSSILEARIRLQDEVPRFGLLVLLTIVLARYIEVFAP
ncbi:hypothetical protein FA95DRAFT_674395 [Auriscalpium vulgare]|uniref:Uncharacterized protein n=1 Tax=Auriscalpium vulgare TaxID=40419 RepID=A0ACB8RDB5_9AGAM|nr:hypothetical protein FA95DRAFT_674395 [Auriscalpium vulgare]